MLIQEYKIYINFYSRQMDGQAMWNQTLDMMQNQSQIPAGYEAFNLNTNVISNNIPTNVRSDPTNNFINPSENVK